MKIKKPLIWTFIFLLSTPFYSWGEEGLSRFDKEYKWLIALNNPKTKLTLSSEDPANPHNSYTYTNALVLTLLSLRGSEEDLKLAQEIVLGLQQLQDEGGPWADAFHFQTGQITAWNRATGPNAWMVLGLLHYYKKTKDPVAWKMAEATTEWLLTNQDKDQNSFTYGGVKLGKAYPFSEVRNTEANANCLAAFYGMSLFAQKPFDRIRYREAARLVARFLTDKLWQKDHFAVAFLNGKGDLSSFPELLDSQTWTLLSLAATEKLHGISPHAYKNGLKWMLQYRTRAKSAEGFSKVTYAYDPNVDTNGDGVVDNSIWVEGVAGAILAFRQLELHRQANYFTSEMEKLKLPSGLYPQMIGPAHLNWPYNLPFASVDALWLIFAATNFNPFNLED